MVNISRYNLSKDSADINDGGVLKNKMDIEDKGLLANVETLALDKTHEYFIEKIKQDEVEIDLSLLFEIHEYFLSDLYDWAGWKWSCY